MCTGSGPIAHMPTIAAAVAVAEATSPPTPWEFSPKIACSAAIAPSVITRPPITRPRKCENRSSFSMLW